MEMVDEHPGVGAIEIERRSEPAFGRPRGIDDRAGVAVTGKVCHRCACAFVEAVRRNEFRLLRHWRPAAPKPDQGYASPNQRYQERQARHGSFTLSHPLDYRQPARAAASSGEFFNLLPGKIQKKLRTVSGLIDDSRAMYIDLVCILKTLWPPYFISQAGELIARDVVTKTPIQLNADQTTYRGGDLSLR